MVPQQAPTRLDVAARYFSAGLMVLCAALIGAVSHMIVSHTFAGYALFAPCGLVGAIFALVVAFRIGGGFGCLTVGLGVATFLIAAIL